MNRVELEVKLNEGRNKTLEKFGSLTPAQLHQPITPSEHDPENHWSALDHFAHLALIERDFNAMIARHFSGDANPVGFMTDDQGEPRTRDAILKLVHASTEKWQRAHHDDSYHDVVALTASLRANTIKLIAELSDEQLQEKLPGAPWDDGTVAGVLGANADHARMHWKWLEEAGLVPG